MTEAILQSWPDGAVCEPGLDFRVASSGNH